MNNFDTSSTGLNIELNACYDLDISRFYFEEAFFTIKEGNKELLVYCEGNFSEFEKQYIFTKKELLAAIMDQFFPSMSESNWLKNDFKAKMGFTLSKTTKQDLIDYAKDTCYYIEDWIAFCEKAGFKSNFDIVVSRDYSQGDYKEIIVPHKFWECIGVKRPDCVQSNLGETIDHLLWDCLIYCRFTVNDEEYFIDQELKDCYNWDKSEALEIAKRLIEKDFTKEEQTVIISFLSNALKNDLDWQ